MSRHRPVFALLAMIAMIAGPMAFLSPPARAADTIPVTVTITTVDALDDGLEGFGRGPADLYAGVRIAGEIDSSIGLYQLDNDHVQPFWVFTRDVPTNNPMPAIEIQIWDNDDCPTSHPFCSDDDVGLLESGDDLADVDPGADNQVDLTVDTATGRWSGDVSWPANCSQGTGENAARVCWDINVGSASNDTDGDGLLDGWERNGFDADSNGSIDVDLPGFGANPNHKDLFLELDYETGQSPTRADILAMKAAFAAAPLSNPDGVNGVNLHVDMGNLVDTTAREGQALGTCSDGLDNGFDGQVDGADPDCVFLDGSVEDPGATNCANGLDDDGDGLADAADPDCLVADNLGGGSAVTPAGACNLDSTFYAAKKVNFNSARRWIFRYGISASLPGTCPSSGGWGEIGGNDFMEFNHDGGTVMHEFGHTLGLRHGGFEDANCKPDYVSGMNYDIQFGINRAGGGTIIDYSPPRIALNGSSRGVVPLGPLVENNLDEATILDGTDNQNRFVFNNANGVKVQNPLNAREDWNGDGDTNDSGLTVNIDNQSAKGRPSRCANTATNSTLKDNNDWAQVSLPFRQFGDSADGAINPTTDPEPTLTELQNLQQDLNTTDLSIGMTDAPDPVGAGEQLVYTLTIANHGPNPATSVQVVDTLPADVSFASASNAGCAAASGVATCNLGQLLAGASVVVTLTVDVPADLVYNNGGPKTIANTATVSNLAGPDSNAGDNNASESTQVISKADLAVTGFATDTPPTQVIIGQTVDVTLVTTVANNGPSSPIDATLTRAASTQAGASVSPTSSSAAVSALAVGSPQTVNETYTLGCAAPGYHDYTFTTAIAPTNAADVDPDPSNNAASLTLTLDCVVPVAINIKPGGNPNSINRGDKGVVPLAVLTTNAGEYGLPLAFDATTIDPLSVHFGDSAAVFNGAGGATEAHNRGHLEDSYELGDPEKVKDGDIDMVLHFPTPDIGLAVDATQACVKGEFTDVTTGMTYRFFGCDAVRIVK